MLKQALILLCEKIIQDNSGKFSYIDCFDIINASSLPARFNSFYICAQLLKMIPEDFYGRVKVIIKAPNGEESTIVQDEVVLKSNKHRLNVHFKDGFSFPWEGIYTIEISISKTDNSWRETFSTDLTVRKVV